MTQKSGSYQFEKLLHRETEGVFLEQRAQLRLDGFISLLLRHGFPTQGKILEVGCAQGVRSHLMASHFPLSEIMGLDRSSELLEKAQLKHKDLKNLTFINADLYELPFADASFDFIYVRLVFMHLNDPRRALQGLQRILKPGGRILIEDADRDCMFFEPSPKSFPLFWTKVQESQRRHGGDPNVGRKLATYFKELHFQNLNIEVQPIIGSCSEIDFLVQTLLPSLNLYLEPQDREMGLSAIEDLHQLAQNPNASFYHFWFVVSAEKKN